MAKSTGGIGFLGILSIVFITLKLLNKIDWSWWYVLMPIYIPSIIKLVILLIAALAALGFSVTKLFPKKRR